ncbi:MAG: hypothetical protein H6739_28600 [Alphaproteobacteria bacterium]|nr:hypothetical protein [Alphaproteobacteria bacterium]
MTHWMRATTLFVMMAGTSTALAADADGDSVDDSVDNCLGVWNPEQTDTDGDTLGDDCDVVVYTDALIGSVPAGQRVEATDAQAVRIAEIINNTASDEPVALVANDPRILLDETSFVIPAGESYSVFAGIDTQGMEAMVASGDVTLNGEVDMFGSTWSDSSTAELAIFDFSFGDCSWQVHVDSVYGINVSDEWTSDNRLEMTSEFTITSSSGSSVVTRGYEIDTGETQYLGDLLASGTTGIGAQVEIPWRVGHRDSDTGPDDTGTGSGVFDFVCNKQGGQKVFDHEIGFDNDNSRLEYTFVVDWKSDGCSTGGSGGASAGVLGLLLGLIRRRRRTLA